MAASTDETCGQTRELIRVSLDDQGREVQNNVFLLDLDASGQRVLIQSQSPMTASDTDEFADLYVYDAAVDVLHHVSTTSQGQSIAGDAYEGRISDDGNHVVLVVDGSAQNGSSAASFQVYRKSLVDGSLELISKNAQDIAGNDDCESVDINGDGSVIVFDSLATNLVPDDTNDTFDVFIWEAGAGLSRLRNRLGQQPTHGASDPVVDSSGRHIAFESSSPEFVAGEPDDGHGDIYWQDRVTPHAMRKVSRPLDGQVVQGNSYWPEISGDGLRVGFTTSATGILPHPPAGGREAALYDVARNRVHAIALTHTGGPMSEMAWMLDLDAHGDNVVMATRSPLAVVPDHDGTQWDVIVRQLDDPLAPEGINHRASEGVDYTQALGDSEWGQISASGDIIAFSTEASNLSSNDHNGVRDVYLLRLSKPCVSLTPSDQVVDESDGYAYVGISLDRPADRTISVDVQTGFPGDTATPGSDYLASIDHTVDIPAGQRGHQLQYSIVDDTEAEAQECFSIRAEVPQTPTQQADAQVCIGANACEGLPAWDPYTEYPTTSGPSHVRHASSFPPNQPESSWRLTFHASPGWEPGDPTTWGIWCCEQRCDGSPCVQAPCLD